MPRLAPLLALALAPSLARADVASPGYHILPTEYTFELDREYPGVQFFLRSGDKDERLDVTYGRPVTVSSAGRFAWQRSAVLVAVLGEERLVTLKATPGIEFRETVPFHDTRNRVTRTYRVSIRANELHLALVHENRESAGVWVMKATAGAFVAAGVVLLGRRVFRRRRTRAAP